MTGKKAQKFAKPTSRLTNDDGKQATTHADERQVFKTYFGRLLCGKPMEFAELMRIERQKYSESRLDSVSAQHVYDSLPHQAELASSYFESAVRKATGEDLILGDVLKLLNIVLSSVYHSLSIKCHLMLRPPL